MADNTAEALAQAFVKKTEVLFQRRIVDSALRGLVGAGMEVAEIADLVKDVLHEIKKESTEEAGTVGSEGNSTATQAGAVPQGDITTANVNNTPTVADNSAARIAELEVKVQALEKKVENKVDKWGPRPDIKASTEGGTFSIKANNMNNNKDPRVHLRPRAAHAQKRKAVDPPPQSSADLVPSRTRSHPTTVLLVMNTLIS